MAMTTEHPYSNKPIRGHFRDPSTPILDTPVVRFAYLEREVKVTGLRGYDNRSEAHN